MAEPIVVVGAGGFGRETLDVIDAINQVAGTAVAWRVVGVVDDAPSRANLERLRARRVPWRGTVSDYLARTEPARYVVGIGAPETRQKVSDRFDSAGHTAATLVHPGATVGFGVTMGAGSIVCSGVRLTTNIILGRHVHLNPNSTVGHDSVLGDFVSMNPASSVSGDCLIGNGVLIGVGAVVLNRISVAPGAVIGASACVVRPVAPREVVAGVPARVLPSPQGESSHGC